MSETQHNGAKMELRCPACGHTVGTIAQIKAVKPNSLIYTDGGSAGPWPPGGGATVSISCPKCDATIGGPASAAKEAVNALAADPSKFFGEFKLQKVD
jgi:hypothetical protein